MYNFEYISQDAKDTLNLGKKLASFLNKGDVVILSGELGSGKTKFVEGFLEHFGLQDEISSPTFNIINEYISTNSNIYHFDVYRLEGSDEFYEIGGEEYFEKGISLIEWGELILDVLPQDYIHIVIKKDESDENKRIFKFEVNDNSKYVSLLQSFKEELN